MDRLQRYIKGQKKWPIEVERWEDRERGEWGGRGERKEKARERAKKRERETERGKISLLDTWMSAGTIHWIKDIKRGGSDLDWDMLSLRYLWWCLVAIWMCMSNAKDWRPSENRISSYFIVCKKFYGLC